MRGIDGSFVAKCIGQALSWYQAGEPAGFVAAVIGAIILLALHRQVVGGRRTRTA